VAAETTLHRRHVYYRRGIAPSIVARDAPNPFTYVRCVRKAQARLGARTDVHAPRRVTRSTRRRRRAQVIGSSRALLGPLVTPYAPKHSMPGVRMVHAVDRWGVPRIHDTRNARPLTRTDGHESQEGQDAEPSHECNSPWRGHRHTSNENHASARNR